MNKYNNYTQYERYDRQMRVPKIGVEGQKKLAKAHIAIVGMGGLGCPASLYLVGAGVGKITLIDHDTVSISNLHRQILYRESDIGKSKSDTAKQTLSAMNQHVQIDSKPIRLTPSNIESLLATADVIVDATDNFALSYLLSDFCMANKKPLISASVIGVYGYVGVFCQRTDNNENDNDSNTLQLNCPCPSVRAVFPHPPEAGDDCNSVGVIGTASGMMGTLQAQEVLKVILGDSHQLAGKLLSIDVWTYRQSIMDFNNANEPSIIVDIICEADIKPSDMVIDVRTLEEVIKEPKHLNNCKIHNISIQEIETVGIPDEFLPQSSLSQSSLSQSNRIVFTCSSGGRALSIADRLIDVGFDNVAVWL